VAAIDPLPRADHPAMAATVALPLAGEAVLVAVQTPEALAGLRLAYILVPMTGTIIAMLIMKGYDISEQRAHEIRMELEARRGARAHG
jgi:GPH family glycoside/pentoside/hexuronide:cation symporter